MVLFVTVEATVSFVVVQVEVVVVVGVAFIHLHLLLLLLLFLLLFVWNWGHITARLTVVSSSKSLNALRISSFVSFSPCNIKHQQPRAASLKQ